jgi:hypothetical protein
MFTKEKLSLTPYISRVVYYFNIDVTVGLEELVTHYARLDGTAASNSVEEIPFWSLYFGTCDQTGMRSDTSLLVHSSQ